MCAWGPQAVRCSGPWPVGHRVPQIQNTEPPADGGQRAPGLAWAQVLGGICNTDQRSLGSGEAQKSAAAPGRAAASNLAASQRSVRCGCDGATGVAEITAGNPRRTSLDAARARVRPRVGPAPLDPGRRAARRAQGLHQGVIAVGWDAWSCVEHRLGRTTCTGPETNRPQPGDARPAPRGGRARNVHFYAHPTVWGTSGPLPLLR